MLTARLALKHTVPWIHQVLINVGHMDITQIIVINATRQQVMNGKLQ